MGRPIRFLLASTVMLAVALLFACSSDDDSPPRSSPDGSTSGGFDAAPRVRREAGVPTKCATQVGSTSSDACSCGETESPFTGPAATKCPTSDAPHYCAEYDVGESATTLRRECTCHPKCLFQRVGGGGDGGADGGTAFDTCRCGVSSHLVLGGDGSRDETRASCDGFAVCCRFGRGCDCTNQAGYACPADAQKVASCGPADFDDKLWKAVAYGGPSFVDVIDVPRCQ